MWQSLESASQELEERINNEVHHLCKLLSDLGHLVHSQGKETTCCENMDTCETTSIEARQELPFLVRMELTWFSRDLFYTHAVHVAGCDGLLELSVFILLRLEFILHHDHIEHVTLRHFVKRHFRCDSVIMQSWNLHGDFKIKGHAGCVEESSLGSLSRR